MSWIKDFFDPLAACCAEGEIADRPRHNASSGGMRGRDRAVAIALIGLALPVVGLIKLAAWTLRVPPGSRGLEYARVRRR